MSPMPNLAQQLKSEIARIAKKEARVETTPLKAASARYRSDIAKLKRQVADLERVVSRVSKTASRPSAPATETAPASLRFRAAGFASLRKKLGLSAADLGKLLGVSAQSVYHWESGKSRPRANQLAAIAELRKLGRREAADLLGAL
jgi:DNA-binding transcriptional regulator YiaG